MLDFDDRPWGRWEEYLNETGYRVKRIIVKPGKRLSLQKHQHRSEHWVIAAGTGDFTLNETVRPIQTGDALYINVGDVHRVSNTGNDDLIIIETQLGLNLEDDIIRLEDDFGRS
jgi:mannose-6-phosphate isomerase-like protein (cupin superfamily)